MPPKKVQANDEMVMINENGDGGATSDEPIIIPTEAEMQAELIAESWVDHARLFKSAPDTSGKIHVLVMDTVTKKIVDDFYAEQTTDGDVFDGVSVMWSRTGEKVGERDLKKEGFTRGKDISYNTYTREMELFR